MKKHLITFTFFLFALFQFHASHSVFALTITAEAQFTPWSGYWWPDTTGGLATGIRYRGHPAPIEKYELLKNGSYPGPATQFELQQNYDPYALAWYGQCDAWASASVYEHINFYPSSVDNIIFYVGDKKGLLTACHQNPVSTRVNAYDPAVFHYWLLHYIKDNGVDFYADLDLGVPIWNYPIYKFEMEIDDLVDKMVVACWISYVDDEVDPDIQGSVVRKKYYTYELEKSGSDIVGGVWTGNSEYDHPQQLVLPITPGTVNPHLDYNFIRKLAASKDDYLESDQPVLLVPGGYNLILLNEDQYIIDAGRGDLLLFDFEKIDTIAEGIYISILDAEGKVAEEKTILSKTSIRLVADNPPYTLSVQRNDYLGGGVYRLEFDHLRSFMYENLKIQKGFGWGGIAIVNPGTLTCDNVCITGYRQDGSPVQTYVGPFSILPGAKKVHLHSDFQDRSIEINDLYAIKISAPHELSVVNLSGYPNRNMSCFTASEGGNRLIIPDTAPSWSFSRFISWGIYNPASLPVSLALALYSKEGELRGSSDLVLDADKASHYQSVKPPFLVDLEGGWIQIDLSNQASVKSYVEWLTEGLNSAETLPGLVPGRNLFIPHIDSGIFWNTKITLINVSDVSNRTVLQMVNGHVLSELEIVLSPREKRVVNIADIFQETQNLILSQCGLFIRSEQDIAGMFAYETANDDIYYPLLSAEDADSDHILAHVASDGYWWTGVSLFNPFDEPVSYTVSGYDDQGQSVANSMFDRVVEPYTKDVWTASSIFGHQSADISSLRIQVTSGPGIAGVFGYGNPDAGMLSGGVF